MYRPTSLLGHFSAVGAFALFNMILAVALAAARHRGFSSVWLGVVMALNVAAMLVVSLALLFGYRDAFTAPARSPIPRMVAESPRRA